MQHRHYFQSDVYIESESEDVKFKRYIENENKRFLQFIDGTITEILPSDFNNNTTKLEKYAIYNLNNVVRIELPDTITIVDSESISSMANLSEVIFPKNIETIGYAVLGAGCDAPQLIADFSKAIKVPEVIETDENGTSVATLSAVDMFKVPAKLYNTWINSSAWNGYKDNIVSV